jgi:hypothetical protein
MILGQVSWLDCFVFLIFLAPQLIIHVGFFATLSCGLQALPFLRKLKHSVSTSLDYILNSALSLSQNRSHFYIKSILNFLRKGVLKSRAVIKLPLGIIYDRILTSRAKRNLFVQQATWFEDIVIRCVRYAFAYIPARIGRVFFSKAVSLPFLRFRMLRHKYLRSPISWHEVKKSTFEGLWMIRDPAKEPDIVIYYAHGGGFSMGSSYFYLEFLLAFLSLLKSQGGFQNPAIFALEYTLVPDASYPTQLHQAIAGYKYILSITHNPSKICVSGDSAGATLILSLLLHLGNVSIKGLKNIANSSAKEDIRPGMAVLISPWVTLVSPKDNNTSADYLDADNLHLYARQYGKDRS